MGQWCSPLWPKSEDAGSSENASRFRPHLLQTFAEFARSTTLPLGPGAEEAFLRFFDSTIGAALANGISWERRESAFRQFRRIAEEAERMALQNGEDVISAQTFERAALDRLEFVRRKEAEKVA